MNTEERQSRRLHPSHRTTADEPVHEHRFQRREIWPDIHRGDCASLRNRPCTCRMFAYVCACGEPGYPVRLEVES